MNNDSNSGPENQRYLEAECLLLEVGERSYARDENGELAVVEVKSVRFWTKPLFWAIRTLLPLRWRSIPAGWAMAHGVEIQEV